MRLPALRTLIVISDWKRTLGNSGVLLVQGVVLDFGGTRRSFAVGTLPLTSPDVCSRYPS